MWGEKKGGDLPRDLKLVATGSRNTTNCVWFDENYQSIRYISHQVKETTTDDEKGHGGS